MALRELKTFHKVVAVAGARVKLTAASTKVRKVKIKALKANTGAIYLGDVTVTAANGYQLNSGDEIEVMDLFWRDGDIIDLTALYIDSAVNGEGVSIVYIS
jgi:high-affinity K+ transport system ATPase subunit B